LNTTSEIFFAPASAASCDGASGELRAHPLPDVFDSARTPLRSKPHHRDLEKYRRWLAPWQDNESLADLSVCLSFLGTHRRHHAPAALTAARELGSARNSPALAAGCDLGLRSAGPIRLAGVLHDMTAAIDGKDPYTCGHSDRVAHLAVQLAKELGWRHEDLAVVHLAGLLHDIGKIGVAAEILCKPAELTPEEYEQVKSHPRLGHEILLDVEPLTRVLPAVLHHHEHWDGSGYPSGLAGDEIPEIARIVAVADAYDAMTNQRPYRSSLPRHEVRRIFLEGQGRHWDPLVLDALLRVGPCFRCGRDPVCSAPLVAPPTSVVTIR